MKRQHASIGLSVIMMLLLVSCNMNEPCIDSGTCDDIYLERTDIEISGDLSIWENQIAYEKENATGPVDLIYYGNPSHEFDFSIAMESGYILYIKMVNKTMPNPWSHTGLGYTCYPGQDLANRLRYVQAELRLGDDAPAYATNDIGVPETSPQKSAFWITSYDEHQIKCRIKDLTLFKNLDNRKVRINGTFVAVANFDDPQSL